MTDGLKNPERRSDAALLCLLIGLGLMGLAWFLGVGGVMATVMSGGDPVALTGGLAALILPPLTAVAGAILALVGFIWICIRVVADQTESSRYGDVER
jgi:uncharacterized RDD family membrane protein YckC